jgi:REP element-mobilizing transposase RayT
MPENRYPEKYRRFSPVLKEIMSYVKLWIHAVWGTKNHERILSKDFRHILFQHIRENAKEKQIYIDFINGDMEHIHCLLTLNADMTIAKVIQLIKGEAAYWANRNFLLKPKLEWADEYFAVSLSESMLNKVRNYIKNQEDHHKKMTFKDEYEKFIKMYGINHHG